jgi:DNA-binding transcriptional regulator GbsR (MarR family)
MLNGTEDVLSLNPVELEVTRLFVQLSCTLGQPPSIAEIYGLLFISAQPLTMDDLIARLRLSNGSASQGLKYLRELGAIRVVEVPGTRRTHYEAVAELRNLVGSFLRRQVSDHLGDSGVRLEQLSEKAQLLTGEERKHVLARVKVLQGWERNVRCVLPFLLRVLGGKTRKTKGSCLGSET